MEISVTSELTVFLWCIVCGSIAAVIFDFFRIVRRLIYSGYIKTSFEDILYWISTGLLIYYFSLRFNGGEIRWYMLFGIMLGAILYFLTASRLIVNGFVIIFRFIGKILMLILKVIYSPIRLILRVIGKPFIIIFDFSHSRFVKISEKFIINIKKLQNFVTKI